jgi:hypothetical protein
LLRDHQGRQRLVQGDDHINSDSWNCQRKQQLRQQAQGKNNERHNQSSVEIFKLLVLADEILVCTRWLFQEAKLMGLSKQGKIFTL